MHTLASVFEQCLLMTVACLHPTYMHPARARPGGRATHTFYDPAWASPTCLPTYIHQEGKYGVMTWHHDDNTPIVTGAPSPESRWKRVQSWLLTHSGAGPCRLPEVNRSRLPTHPLLSSMPTARSGLLTHVGGLLETCRSGRQSALLTHPI